MAQDPNVDNLKGLISIQEQLAANTDEIHSQVKEMGLLGTNFQNILNLSKGINTALNEAARIQADTTKTFFTGERHEKAMKEIIRQVDVIKANIAIRDKKMSVENASAYKQAVLAQGVIKERNAEIEKAVSLIEEGNLSKDKEKELTKKIGTLSRQNIKTEELLGVLTSSKVVKERLLLDYQEEALEGAIEFSNEYRKADKFFNNFSEKLQDLGKRLGKSSLVKGVGGALGLGGAEIMFKDLVQIALKFDSSLTDIAKSSGVTKDFAQEIGKSYGSTVHNLVLMNSSLDASQLTVTAMLKAQQELQDSSGQLSLFDEKRVEDQLTLTKQFGLQADEAAKVAQLSMLSNKSTSQATNEIFEQVALSNKLTGLRTSGKDILKEVAKIEGILTVQYKNNPKLIAAAAAEAKSLGINLQQAAQASLSLLDFESSIANELEAELLTGKKWNLEKARSLALDGDSAGAVKEMLANVGSLADFQKQNVISREAEAKAVGMTADELANALRTQEVLKKSSSETVKAYDEILSNVTDINLKTRYKAELDSATNAKEMQQRISIVSAQEKFESSMERVREAIGQIGSGPIIGIINGIASLTENATALKTVLIGISATMSAIATASLITAFGMSLATGGANIAVGASALLGGGLMAYGLYGGKTKTVQDSLISPSGGIMISTPEGMIKPSSRDHVITTTDPQSVLGGGNNKQEQLLSAILNAVSKPGSVYLDSNKVGTTLGISYNSFA